MTVTDDQLKAWRELTDEAIEVMKQGRLVRREGWNGKNMHLYLEDCFSMTVRGGIYKGSIRDYEPCIVMVTAQQRHRLGWLASQADMLAVDWIVVNADAATKRGRP